MSTSEQDAAAIISLRVLGASPDEVTARLGLRPTKVLLKGHARIGRGGRYSPQEKDAWLLERSLQTIDEVPAVLAALAKSLAPRRAELQTIRETADLVDIIIGLFIEEGTGGLELGPDLLKELADLGLAVGFDIYSSADSD